MEVGIDAGGILTVAIGVFAGLYLFNSLAAKKSE
jgi:hypothetical protein